MKLKYAEDWRTKYWELAYAWSEQKDWSYHTESDRYYQEMGIAEYLANQEGKTTFLSNVGKEYDVL